MLSSPGSDQLIAEIALAVIGLALVAWLLPRQRTRVRQHGGRPAAQAVTAVAVVALAVSLQPELFDLNTGLTLTILAVFVVFRPEAVVRLVGGQRAEFRALAAGTRLRQLVATHPDRASAESDPAVGAQLAALAASEAPATARYVALVRSAVFAEPDGAGSAARLADLAVEEARLRRAVGPRPAFEGGPAKVDEAPVREPPARDG